MLRFSNVSVFLMMALALAACGEDEQAGNYDSARVIEDPRNVDDPVVPDETQNVEDLLLEAVSETRFTVELRETVELEVALVKETSRAPIAGESITWTILQAPDTTTQLSEREVVTTEDGRAKVSVDAGELDGQIVIRATFDGVAPVEFVIDVTDVAPGNIEVSIFPPSGVNVDLAPYRVRAYPKATLDCRNFPRRADIAGYIAGVEATGTLVTLADIAAEQVYTVTVQGMGTSNSAIAWGCVDDVDVLTRETTSISVPLELVPLNPSGTYDVTGFWNIADAIRGSGDAGAIVIGLIDFLANPGQFIYNLVINEIQSAIGFDLTTFLQIAGIPTLIEDTINGWLFQNEDLAKFREISLAISSMLYTLEVESELIIDKTEADLTFTGFEHWQKIILNLSWRCDAMSPPDCGRYEIPVDADGNLPGLGHVSYNWEGAVVDYDKLEISSHQTTIDYGALLVTIIDQVIVPELTGGNANSLADALAYWIDCPGLAAQIAGCASGMCLGAQLVEGACVAAATTAANQVVQPLMTQSVSLDLEFDGDAVLFDSASNGFVDQIVDGHNNGVVVGSGAPVTVDWTADLIHP